MKKTNDKKVYDLIFEHYYPLITGTKKPNVQSVSEENSIPYEEIKTRRTMELHLNQAPLWLILMIWIKLLK